MLSEEKKAIEKLKDFKSISILYGNTFTMFLDQLEKYQEATNTVLNLIDKLKNENEQKDKYIKNSEDITTEMKNDINKLLLEIKEKDKQIKDLKLRKDNQEKRFKIYKENIDKQHEEIYENLVSEKEKYKYLYQKALDNTVKSDKKNIQLKKQIDLMAEKINEAYFEENDFYLWFEKIFGIIPKGNYKEEIKQHFEKVSNI